MSSVVTCGNFALVIIHMVRKGSNKGTGDDVTVRIELQTNAVHVISLEPLKWYQSDKVGMQIR